MRLIHSGRKADRDGATGPAAQIRARRGYKCRWQDKCSQKQTTYQRYAVWVGWVIDFNCENLINTHNAHHISISATPRQIPCMCEPDSDFDLCDWESHTSPTECTSDNRQFEPQTHSSWSRKCPKCWLEKVTEHS